MEDIEKLSDEELNDEWEACQKLWGRFSYDCFGFYIEALRKEFVKRDNEE